MKFLAFVLLVFVALVVADDPWPRIPEQFKADVEVTIPFVGKVSGTNYWDYPNLRQRLDTEQFGAKMIELDLYAMHDKCQIQSMWGTSQCKCARMDDEMYPMSVPPIAVLSGTETINGKLCNKYELDWPMATLYWYVHMTPDENFDDLVRFTMVVGGQEMGSDFRNMEPGPQADSLFDVVAMGCPAPKPPVTFTVAGYSLDATTAHSIGAVDVILSGPWSDETTSSDQGVFTFSDVAPGNYTLIAKKDGYFVAKKDILISSDVPKGTIADIYLSPKLPAASYRFVLSWGANPRDLDSHLKTDCGCEVLYSHRSCNCDGSISRLDVDRTTGFGPETVTVKSAGAAGEFTYFVYIFSGVGTFSTSEGNVKVYNTDGEWYNVSPPEGQYTSSDRYWTIGKLNGKTKQFELINKVGTKVF